MIKWQYGFGLYKSSKQSAEAFNNMIDLAEVGERSLAHFLEIAGEKGWELCTSVPLQERTYGPVEERSYGLIFKRPKEL